MFSCSFSLVRCPSLDTTMKINNGWPVLMGLGPYWQHSVIYSVILFTDAQLFGKKTSHSSGTPCKSRVFTVACQEPQQIIQLPCTPRHARSRGCKRRIKPGLSLFCQLQGSFSVCLLCFWCTWCFVSLFLVVSTSAIDCLERLVSEMTYRIMCQVGC